MPSIAIIGFPESGKKALGQKLAHQLGKGHVHLKTLFEEHNGFHMPKARDFSRTEVLSGEMMKEIIRWDLPKKYKRSPSGLVITSPRTVEQAEVIDSVLEEHQMPIGKVVFLCSTLNQSTLVMIEKLSYRGAKPEEKELEYLIDQLQKNYETRRKEIHTLIEYYEKEKRIVWVSAHNLTNSDLVLTNTLRALKEESCVR